VEQKAPHAIRNALCCNRSNLLFVLSEAELQATAPLSNTERERERPGIALYTLDL